MSAIKGKDTSPEIKLRKALWALGLRYRKHYKGAPGSPDIAFVAPKVAVFCDGIFWHGRDWETRKARLSSENTPYWVAKIERNMARDRRIEKELNEAGWAVLRFWEDEIDLEIERCVCTIESLVTSRNRRL